MKKEVFEFALMVLYVLGIIIVLTLAQPITRRWRTTESSWTTWSARTNHLR